jgi:hypothetical protein
MTPIKDRTADSLTVHLALDALNDVDRLRRHDPLALRRRARRCLRPLRVRRTRRGRPLRPALRIRRHVLGRRRARPRARARAALGVGPLRPRRVRLRVRLGQFSILADVLVRRGLGRRGRHAAPAELRDARQDRAVGGRGGRAAARERARVPPAVGREHAARARARAAPERRRRAVVLRVRPRTQRTCVRLADAGAAPARALRRASVRAGVAHWREHAPLRLWAAQARLNLNARSRLRWPRHHTTVSISIPLTPSLHTPWPPALPCMFPPLFIMVSALVFVYL